MFAFILLVLFPIFVYFPLCSIGKRFVLFVYNTVGFFFVFYRAEEFIKENS